jgi:hypothetical protein
MARNIVEDYITNQKLKQTIATKIIGSFYINLKMFQDSDEYQHIVLLNHLGQPNNLNLKSKEILDKTLRTFVKEFDYLPLEKMFKQGKLELNGFQSKMADDQEIPPYYKKKFKEHMKRYLNRQQWISNLTKIDWQTI